MIRLGLENLLTSPPAYLAGRRLGLLCNHASTDRRLRAGSLLLQQLAGHKLTCLFTPQHGFFATKQDNMVESAHGRDPLTGLPVYSLYAETRRPTADMLADIDILLVDLVDVGTRVYTFFWTVYHCLEAAREHNRQVVILDRPNPLGGQVLEGNLLGRGQQSFVGLWPLPMRHGLTMGEFALLVNQKIGADCTVIPMSGWRRDMLFEATRLPWVFPSPNMPTVLTAQVYPGQVLWEGTNISEGRGTTMPFVLFGAPFIDPWALLSALKREYNHPGCYLRPVSFEPTANKWQGEECHGLQIHVIDPVHFRPYLLTLHLLQLVRRLYPDQFAYKAPPYEYEFHRLPMDLIIGDPRIRRRLEEGEEIGRLEQGWQQEVMEFDRMRQEFLLYS